MTEDELITDIAEAFGGVQRLADHLHVNRRIVMRWMNGHYEIPVGIWRDLEVLLMQRRYEVVELFAAARTARLEAMKRQEDVDEDA